MCCNTKPLAAEDVPREGPPAAPPLEETAKEETAEAAGIVAASSHVPQALAAMQAADPMFADMHLLAAPPSPFPIIQASATSAISPTSPVVAAGGNGNAPSLTTLSPGLSTQVSSNGVSSNDTLVARVNGEAIYASSLQPLIDQELMQLSDPSGPGWLTGMRCAAN